MVADTNKTHNSNLVGKIFPNMRTPLFLLRGTIYQETTGFLFYGQTIGGVETLQNMYPLKLKMIYPMKKKFNFFRKPMLSSFSVFRFFEGPNCLLGYHTQIAKEANKGYNCNWLGTIPLSFWCKKY